MNPNDKPSMLDRLTEQGRRLSVARMLPANEPISPQLACEIIEDFYGFIKQHEIQLTTVARELGKGYSVPTLSTLANVKTGKFKGDLDRIARGVNSWMENYIQRQNAPMPGGYVETQVARKMLAVATNVLSTGTIGVIYGPAGVGKTMVIQVIESRIPGSIRIRIKRNTRTPFGLAKKLCEVLSVKARSFYEAEENIIQKLAGSNRLLIIDEAHELNTDTLNLLRDIHDEARLPMLLVGTIDINKKVSDTDQFYGQFNRRVMFKYNVIDELISNAKNPRPLFTKDEIEAVFASDKIRLTSDGLDFLTHLCNIPGLGGLGFGDKIVRGASLVCQGKAIDAKLMRRVIRQMQDSGATIEMHRRMDNLKMRVA